MKNNKKFLKVFAFIVGIFFGLFLLVLIIPSFINLDKYKDKIISEISSHIEGEFDYKTLKLSLLTGIKFDIKNINLNTKDSEKIVSIDQISLKIPYLSFLKATPYLELIVDQPKLSLVQKNNKLNVLTVLPTKKDSSDQSKKSSQPSISKSSPLPESNSEPKSNSSSESAPESSLLSFLPSSIQKIITNSLYTIKIQKATFEFILEQKKLIDISDFSFALNNLSFKEKSDFQIYINLDSSLDSSTYLSGPVRLNGSLTPNISGYSLQINVDLSDMSYSLSSIISKSKSEPGSLELSLSIDPKDMSFDLSKLNVSLPGINSTTTAKVKDLSHPQISLDNSTSLKLNTLDLSAKTSVSIDIKDSRYTLNSKINSSVLDINSILDLLSKSQSKSNSNSHTKSNSQTSSTSSDSSVSFSLQKDSKTSDISKIYNDLSANPIVQKLVANVDVNIQKIKYKKLVISNFKDRLAIKRKSITNSTDLKISDAKLSLDIQEDLTPSTPFKLVIKTKDLDLESLIKDLEIQYKDTISGKMDLDLLSQGSVQSKDLLGSIFGTGKISIRYPVLSMIDITKILDTALQQLSDKLKEQSGYDLTSKNDYKKIKQKLSKQKFTSDRLESQVELKNKTFRLKNFLLKATPNRGIDIKGNATVNLNNLDLGVDLMLEDTYKITQLEQVDITHSKLQVKHVLVDQDGGIFKLPLKIQCKLVSPCYKFKESSEYISKVVEKNIKTQLKAETQKELKEQTNKVKGQLKSLFKKHKNKDTKNKEK